MDAMETESHVHLPRFSAFGWPMARVCECDQSLLKVSLHLTGHYQLPGNPHWLLPLSLYLSLSHPLNLTFYIFQLIQYIPLRTKLAKLSTTFIFIHHGIVINAHVQNTLQFIPFQFPFKDRIISLINKTVTFKYNKHVRSTIIMVSQQFSKTSSSPRSFFVLYIFQHCTVCTWSRD